MTSKWQSLSLPTNHKARYPRYLRKASSQSEQTLRELLHNWRKCLEAKNKQLKKEGKSNRPYAAEALSDDEINILYEKTSWEFQTEKHW